MPVLSRILSIALRTVEIICGAVVAGIIGYYLNSFDKLETWSQARWIYTEVVAAVSIILGFLWLIPCSFGFFSWPFDVIISCAWFAAFGILVDTIHKSSCGSTWDWGGITHGDSCGRWKAAEAFSFISACVWMVSGIVGIWFTFRSRRSSGLRSAV
ncbi:MARVEL domain-containing protein [Aspergillus candidus]|uniref:Integral membrane protein n=1 Tax=Aspergillus candidus TaxID=41067 RepID=A0A2I2FBB2_ASPCN|nr:integral membrane protein [Aspergillus candidus]PLB37919.1 integral membrane protein [Aspergillus candidus]